MDTTRIFKDLSTDGWLTFVNWFDDYAITNGKKFLHQLCHPSVIQEITDEFDFNGEDPASAKNDEPVTRGADETKKDFKKRCLGLIDERCRTAIMKAVSPKTDADFLKAVRTFKCASRRPGAVNAYRRRFQAALSNLETTGMGPEAIRNTFLAGLADPVLMKDVDALTRGKSPKETAEIAYHHAQEVDRAIALSEAYVRPPRLDDRGEKRARTDSGRHKFPRSDRRNDRTHHSRDRGPPREKDRTSSRDDSRSRSDRDMSTVECFKCGRPGHYASKCRTPQAQWVVKPEKPQGDSVNHRPYSNLFAMCGDTRYL